MGSGTIIPFTFEEEAHVYRVEGHYCLATSDIIAFAGLSDYAMVPIHNLEHARWRGTKLHRTIQFFEEGDLDADDLPDEILPYFEGYLKFKKTYDFVPIPPMEKGIVYEHDATGQMVGCHIDLRGFVREKLYIVDPKTSFKNSGQARKQTHLRWRMQLQSYLEATAIDESFWMMTDAREHVGRSILHLHKDGGYEFIDFTACDDAQNWEAMVRTAQLKLANGFKRPEK